MSEKEQMPPLEAGLLTAMRAIDNQIARAMQRSPEQLEAHGVQKWEPYQQRIESISSFIMTSLGKRHVELDSLLVLSQAFSKSLALIVEDLGEEGLGKVRALYCREALAAIERDASSSSALLAGTPLS